jgi:DNA replication protein DnaC
MQDKRRRSIIPELITASGIAEVYFKYDHEVAARKLLNADEPMPKSLYRWVEARVNDSIWIGGINDIGKTHTLMHWGYKLIRKYAQPCIGIRSPKFLRAVTHLRTGDRIDRAKGAKMERAVMTTQLLIIEDIGKENLSEAKAELLNDILDERDKYNRKVWVDTNGDGEKLKMRMNNCGQHDYGNSIIARLKRMVPRSNRLPEPEMTGE